MNQSIGLLKTLLDEMPVRLQRLEGSISREVRFPQIAHKILVAIGMRRTGKTFFLLQQLQDLLDSGQPLSRVLFIDFEDDRLLPLSKEKLASLVETFYSMYPENHEEECFLFFDEIQNVPEWSIVIRRIFGTKKAKIFLSGSSAKLLSKEIATELRGRSLSVEIWPYSFSEYLTAKHKKILKKPLGQKDADKQQKHLREYLDAGGFPETIGPDVTVRLALLQEYVNTVMFRDIVERHKVANINLLKYLISTLLKTAGCTFTVNKFYNDAKSRGITVSRNTIYEYFNYIEDAYLIFSVPLYSGSYRKSQINPKKIYAIDTGLINAYRTQQQKNLGHMFENLIYLDLRRRGYEINYYLTKQRNEVDFFAQDLHKEYRLYQVVWDISNEDTLAREQRALQEAEQELGVKGKMITPDNYFAWLDEI